MDVRRLGQKISADLLKDFKLLEAGIGMALPNPLVGDESHVPVGFIVFHNHSAGQQLLRRRIFSGFKDPCIIEVLDVTQTLALLHF